MAAAISPGTGQAYGVARVCDGFGVARSSFYAWRQQQDGSAGTRPASLRRGPKPANSDTAVLSAIRADLERSPWIGEGHRKVWARLRVLDGIRVARKRILRLMRENGLLSPHRHLARSGEAHDGRIVTDAPNLMWGTDATQIATVLDGKVWLFAVVEHWNAEALGWHVAKIGDRYAAAQAVGLAVKTVFGAVAAEVARGLGTVRNFVRGWA
jgi:transposase InsO family protein